MYLGWLEFEENDVRSGFLDHREIQTRTMRERRVGNFQNGIFPDPDYEGEGYLRWLKFEENDHVARFPELVQPDFSLVIFVQE